MTFKKALFLIYAHLIYLVISSCILIFGVYCVKLKIHSNKVFKSHLELYFYLLKKKKGNYFSGDYLAGASKIP